MADLLKENNFNKVDEEKIQLACDGIMSPEEVDAKLKDLVDLGVLAEQFNPETNQNEFCLKEDEKPKLLPLLKDILKD